MAGQKIRIRLKSYDHEVIDSSARKIVETVKGAGATVVGPVTAADREERLLCYPFSPQVQGQPRALRDAYAQASDRRC